MGRGRHGRASGRRGRLLFLAALLASLVVLFTPASGVPSAFPGADKLVHLLVFGGLALTGRLAALPAGALAAGLIGYAVGSELLQGALPLGRSAEPLDVLADVVGIGLGWVVARKLRG